MTREEIKKRMDELAREYQKTHDPLSDFVIKRKNSTKRWNHHGVNVGGNAPALVMVRP
jgi:hypothetical protein